MVIVIAYLALNTVVLTVAAHEIWRHPEVLTAWRASLFVQHGNPAMMAATAVILFPKLALGLSGFETGVAVMPLVRGDRDGYRRAAPREESGTPRNCCRRRR